MRIISIGLGLLLSSLFPRTCVSQDQPETANSAEVSLPQFLHAVHNRSSGLNVTITSQNIRYLTKLSKLESRLLQQLRKIDPNAAGHLSAPEYNRWIDRKEGQDRSLISEGSLYIPRLDSLLTTLKYLQTQFPAGNGPPLECTLPAISRKLADVELLQQAGITVRQLQAHLDESLQIDQYIGARRQQIAQLLSQYTRLPTGISRTFSEFKQTGYYYRQQIEQIRQICNDPHQIEKRAFTYLNTLPSYRQYLARHSMLASLFRLPADYGSDASTAGYQTRDQVQRLLSQQAGTSGLAGQALLQQQLQTAHDRLTTMQNQLSRYGIGGQELDMPHFRPNHQKTKPFIKRLVYGTNLQLAKASTYFPATGELGLSIGYRINDNSTAGIGISYNFGLGRDWGHMQWSNQGVGLRSYLDWKVKKSYYLAGGYEINYLTPFSTISQLKQYNAWQPSALIGLEKKYRISSRVQGNIQLLFDALYRKELPPGQPFKFRVGYVWR